MKNKKLNSNRNIEVDTNPIEKISLVVLGCEGNLLIGQLIGEENDKNATSSTRGCNNAAYMITQACNFMSIIFFDIFAISFTFEPSAERITSRKC